MVKNAPKSFFFSFIILALSNCSTSPSYSRRNIEPIIKNICQDEFAIDVIVKEKGDTIWVYAPFRNLIDENKQFVEKSTENLRHIFLSLKRVILSMDSPPRFYVFVASNIENFGIDIYQVGFVPDIVRYELQFISQQEFQERMVYLPSENAEALGDSYGDHIDMFDFDMANFITYLTLQKITRTFSDEKIKNFVEINNIGGSYEGRTLSITIDITVRQSNPLVPDSFKETKKTIIEFLTMYKEFSPDITIVEINDIYSGKKRTFSLNALLEN